MEWVIGNTFTMVVWGTYGSFWLAFGATLTPFYNAVGAYTVEAKTEAEITAAMAEFNSTLAFFILFVGLVSTIFLVCSLRTNAIFVLIFMLLDICLFTLCGSYWVNAEGNTELSATLLHVCPLQLYSCLLRKRQSDR
jgi:succinate-acetate transporter protein